jgi:hypothetical protein
MSNKNQQQTEEPDTNTLHTDGGVTTETVEEENVEDEVKYVPTTFYLTEETQRELKRWFMETTLNNVAFEKAERREQHEVMVRFVMDNTDDVVESVRQFLAEE